MISIPAMVIAADQKYRAVDRDGNTVDFRFSRKRDVATAKAFFARC
jgi:transposase-like protein